MECRKLIKGKNFPLLIKSWDQSTVRNTISNEILPQNTCYRYFKTLSTRFKGNLQELPVGIQPLSQHLLTVFRHVITWIQCKQYVPLSDNYVLSWLQLEKGVKSKRLREIYFSIITLNPYSHYFRLYRIGIGVYKNIPIYQIENKGCNLPKITHPKRAQKLIRGK